MRLGRARVVQVYIFPVFQAEEKERAGRGPGRQPPIAVWSREGRGSKCCHSHMLQKTSVRRAIKKYWDRTAEV